MLTKQEQEILDNAPDGYDMYVSSGYYIDSKHGQSSVDGRMPRCMLITDETEYDRALPLADLSKKQGKTVVELFDGHRYSFYVDDNLHIGMYIILRNAFFDADTGNKICGAGQATNIKLKPELLTPVAPITQLKPRTKVEYVKVDNTPREIYQMLLTGDELYVNKEDKIYFDGEQFMRDDSRITYIKQDNNIYRKVETEITWRDEAKELLIPAARQYKHNNGIGFLCGYGCDETVQIVADLIEKLHLVTSLTKQQPQKEGSKNVS